MRANLIGCLLIVYTFCGCVSSARRAALFEDDERQRYSVRDYVTDAELLEVLRHAHEVETAAISEADRQEGAGLRLHGYLYSAGDRRFAAALRREPQPVLRSAAR